MSAEKGKINLHYLFLSLLRQISRRMYMFLRIKHTESPFKKQITAKEAIILFDCALFWHYPPNHFGDLFLFKCSVAYGYDSLLCVYPLSHYNSTKISSSFHSDDFRQMKKKTHPKRMKDSCSCWRARL